MITGKRIMCLIPARGGSKGLPRKNITVVGGLPLLGWPIRAAKASKYIDRIVVSTDDTEIARIAVDQGAEVPFIRPAEIATDNATSMSVIEHAIGHLNLQGDSYEYIVLLEPTSPLTDSTDVDRAMELLHSQRAKADSIVGVSRIESQHPVFSVILGENGLIKPFLSSGFPKNVRRQDLTDLYFFEGTLYISDIQILLRSGSFYHDRTLPFIVPKWKAFEIDDVVDLICVEAIMKNLHKINR